MFLNIAVIIKMLSNSFDSKKYVILPGRFRPWNPSSWDPSFGEKVQDFPSRRRAKQAGVFPGKGILFPKK